MGFTLRDARDVLVGVSWRCTNPDCEIGQGRHVRLLGLADPDEYYFEPLTAQGYGVVMQGGEDMGVSGIDLATGLAFSTWDESTDDPIDGDYAPTFRVHLWEFDPVTVEREIAARRADPDERYNLSAIFVGPPTRTLPVVHRQIFEAIRAGLHAVRQPTGLPAAALVA